MEKCKFENPIYIMGMEVDPCIYKEIQRVKNVTVIVSKCQKCGNIDIQWIRQDNSEELEVEE